MAEGLVTSTSATLPATAGACGGPVIYGKDLVRTEDSSVKPPEVHSANDKRIPFHARLSARDHLKLGYRWVEAQQPMF